MPAWRKEMQDIQMFLPIGSIVLDRYRVEELLGKGGSGAVYLVQDLRVEGNQFALKEIIEPDKKELARFAFEGKLLQRLDHEALPRVYRVFEDAQSARVYMLMDYIKGSNLDTLRHLQPQQKFPLPQVMAYMAPIVDAVTYLHQQTPPIIHRDIKPANIIVPDSGENTILVDFGIAKEYDLDGTTSAIRRASPGYGAPEQYATGTNPRTDVYGMAATFYALLTGSLPADAFHRLAVLSSQQPDPLIPVNQIDPYIPAFVADAIEHAMDIESDKRFPTIQGFWQALQAHPLKHAPEPPQILLTPEQSLPTSGDIEDISTVPVSTTSRQQAKRAASKWVSPLRLVLIFLALAALLIDIVFAINALSQHQGLSTSPVRSTTPGHAQSIAFTPSPSVSLTFFSVAHTYAGTIHNTPAKIITTMRLTNIQQHGATISGYLVLGSGLSGDGSFNGTITTHRHISFLVVSQAGHLPLFFMGQVNANGGMSGSYCSAQHNQCDYAAGGYGTWNVLPLSSTSASK
jgi:serine/threonine protein kinase